MASGGYRAPGKPNVVSGPGKFSKRTDGGAAQVLSAAPDQPYGAVKQQLDSQRIAPMGAATPLPPVPQPGQGGPAQAPQMPQYNGAPFGAPTQRPDEPVTAGADAGPGPGSDVLNAPQAAPQQGTGAMTNLLQKLSAADGSGVLGQLLVSAQAHGV
jgi:hypothetical protein